MKKKIGSRNVVTSFFRPAKSPVFDGFAPFRNAVTWPLDGNGRMLGMRRVLHYRSSANKYHCDAVVVACFDHRFDRVLRKFLKRIGIVNPDPIIVAGGAKTLASPEHEADREFLVGQMEKSVKLHGTGRVILLLHSDCGAYGGLHQTFKDNEALEVAHHRDELHKAHRVASDAFPAVNVECYFLDFAGVWQFESTAAY
jgi:carbonic anhydrase